MPLSFSLLFLFVPGPIQSILLSLALEYYLGISISTSISPGPSTSHERLRACGYSFAPILVWLIGFLGFLPSN